jgi:Uma2 family endonuclease
MATADLLNLSAPPRRDPAPRLWSDAEFAQMQQLGLFAGRDVELVAGVIFERHAGVPFVFTRKEYYALGDNHFFRDQRVQLIGGVILEETAVMNPPHATAIQLTTRTLNLLFGAGHDVRCQLPLNLGLVSEPEPDVAVVTGSPRDYLSEHPTTAILVVEVAEATIEDDTHDKASLYASGGIADYWVVDLTTDRVLVFRSPKPDPNAKFGHDYASVAAYGRDDKFSPLAAPNARVQGSDLLP